MIFVKNEWSSGTQQIEHRFDLLIRTRPKVKEVKEMEEVKEVKEEEGRTRKKARKKTEVKKKINGRREKRKARRAGPPLIHPNSRSPAPGGCILLIMIRPYLHARIFRMTAVQATPSNYHYH